MHVRRWHSHCDSPGTAIRPEMSGQAEQNEGSDDGNLTRRFFLVRPLFFVGPFTAHLDHHTNTRCPLLRALSSFGFNYNPASLSNLL
jgi:hypothetical protein